jgi:hypothetical protein
VKTLEHRKGEAGAVPFRTGRFFVVENKWYFACREGMDKGPYYSRNEAETALKAFLTQCEEVAHALGGY